MPAVKARIVFVMPRCRHDHVRAAHKQAHTLVQAGYEVVLVVKKQLVREYLGMRVIEARAPFRSVLRPLLNLVPLFLQVRRLQGDVHVLRNPDTIPLALILRLFGKKVIYDTHEDFSKRPLAHPSLPRWSRRGTAWLITRLERLLARTTNGVIVTQQQQLQGLGGRTMWQPNAPMTTGPIVGPALEADITRDEQGLSFIYVGEITRARGVFAMLELMQTINEEYDARLELIGWIRSDELSKQVQQHPGWRFVRFHGACSHSDTLKAIRRADIGLALLRPVVDYPTTSITKLFEYMQFGVPFVASDFDAWRVSTELGPPGLYVNPDCAQDIAAAARRLAGDASLRERMGEAGRLHIRAEFNWERISNPFVALVKRQFPGNSGTWA